jgi:hypothetical protein
VPVRTPSARTWRANPSRAPRQDWPRATATRRPSSDATPRGGVRGCVRLLVHGRGPRMPEVCLNVCAPRLCVRLSIRACSSRDRRPSAPRRRCSWPACPYPRGPSLSACPWHRTPPRPCWPSWCASGPPTPTHLHPMPATCVCAVPRPALHTCVCPRLTHPPPPPSLSLRAVRARTVRSCSSCGCHLPRASTRHAAM